MSDPINPFPEDPHPEWTQAQHEHEDYLQSLAAMEPPDPRND